MKDNSKIVAIVLVVITAIVVIVTFIADRLTKDDEVNNVSIVTNYSDFYTVNSCLYRTISYLSVDDSESLLLLLNESYKKNNKITIDNVLDLFLEVAEDSTFVSEKMYYETLSSSTVKYYVKGYIKENQIYDYEVFQNIEYDTIYFIVYLDSNNNIFSIEPYDGDIFKAGDTNET